MVLLLITPGCGMVSRQEAARIEERFRQIRPGMEEVEAITRLGAPDRFFTDAHARWTEENSKTGDVTALDVWSDSQGVIRRVSVVPQVANLKGHPLEDPVYSYNSLPRENLDTNQSSYTPSRSSP